MIVSIIFAMVGVVFDSIMSIFGYIPAFDQGLILAAYQVLDMIATTSSGFIFFMIRPSTFFAALDILAFIHFAEPLYHFVMWLLRKLPFLGIK